MNRKDIIIATTLAVTLFFTSCGKEDIAGPVIHLTELGYDNTRIGYAGSDLHIEADIIAEGKIDVVTVEIHPEGEHAGKSASQFPYEDEWEVDTTYTKFSGLHNTTFHEHISIPVDTEASLYHFHFLVTDKEGFQTVVEEEIEIQQPVSR